MLPLLLIYLYKKKGKEITRTAKKVLSKAKVRKKPIKNVYSKFRSNRFNRKRARN